MVDSLRHESFYVTGTWIDEALGVYVGWVIRKDSFSDGMPLRNERTDRVLVFSGEEFPDPGTKDRLRGRGHTLGTASADYLVHLAEEEPSFPATLNGRFQGLLIDQTCGLATLFNDRYGLERIYYHESADTFYFAAEAKAILAVRPELRAIDARGMAELVSCGCVLENRTVFQGIQVLPPASAWTYRNSSIERRDSYFMPSEWESQTVLGTEDYYEELRGVFSRNIPRYFDGPQQIGMSLTGGLDSRMIMAWGKPSPGSLPCYSFGGSFRECQDVIMGRKVAQACGQPYQVILVGDEFQARFDHYAERTVYLSDGCTDVSRSSDLYINEMARQIGPVRMTGNYGGEVLRRVRAFKPVDPPAGLFSPELSTYFHQAKNTYRGLLQGHPLSFAVFRQAPWHHYGLLALEQTQLSLRSPYLDNEFVRTVFRAPQSSLTSNDISLRLIKDGNPALSEIRTDRGLAGTRGQLSSALLRQYLEFTFKAEYAYDYGMPQWVARVDHAFAPLHLERLFLGRHKFYHFRVWYRDAIARYVQSMLLDPRTLSRPYVQRGMVEAIVKGHLKGTHNYTTAIHKLLTLEHLHRLFID
jgi:asparagine synthase (glutamine-hydrolysing)